MFFDSLSDVTESLGHKDDWTDAADAVEIIQPAVLCLAFSHDHK
jgi:hypothetical protein